jgi:hypothetical protein
LKIILTMACCPVWSNTLPLFQKPTFPAFWELHLLTPPFKPYFSLKICHVITFLCSRPLTELGFTKSGLEPIKANRSLAGLHFKCIVPNDGTSYKLKLLVLFSSCISLGKENKASFWWKNLYSLKSKIGVWPGFMLCGEIWAAPREIKAFLEYNI